MSESTDARYWIGCVDDDRPFLESAGRLIGRAVGERPFEVSCEVELASNADEFSEIADEMEGEGAELALLVTDQIMPECSGLELIQRVKEDHPATSCVLLTGYAGLESARYAINNRLLDRYVCKPIEDMAGFSEMVVSELERFHLRRVEAVQSAEIGRKTQQLRQANDHLDRMKQIAERVAYFSRELRTLDLDEVLDLVCDKAPALFGARSCFLFVPDHNNRLTLWRERRIRCAAPVPPGLDINKVMRQAMVTRRPVVTQVRGWCTGMLEDTGAAAARDEMGCVVMPLQLSHRDPAFVGGDHPANAPPAMLCLCGIEGKDNLCQEDLEYKVLLINDILGANIANALAYTETERLAKEDSLTGAKTRRAFDELLQGEWERYRRYQCRFCVALMDVDHLKQINDTYGHAAGDEVLRRTVEIATRRSRRCDALARYGGDEFCMLLPETSLDGAETMMRRIEQDVSEAKFTLMRAPAGVSIGIGSSEGKKSPDEVLAEADARLYAAKRASRRSSGPTSGEPRPPADGAGVKT